MKTGDSAESMQLKPVDLNAETQRTRSLADKLTLTVGCASLIRIHAVENRLSPAKEAKGAKRKAIYTSRLRPPFSGVRPSMAALVFFADFAFFAGHSVFPSASFRLHHTHEHASNNFQPELRNGESRRSRKTQKETNLETPRRRAK